MATSTFNTKKAVIISTAVITPLVLATGGVLGIYFLAPSLIPSLLTTLSASLTPVLASTKAGIVAGYAAVAAKLTPIMSSKISLAATTVYATLAPYVASAASALFSAAYTVGNTLLGLVGLNSSLSVNAIAGIGAGIIAATGTLLTAGLSGVLYGVANALSKKPANNTQVKTTTETAETAYPSPVILDSINLSTIETARKPEARLSTATKTSSTEGKRKHVRETVGFKLRDIFKLLSPAERLEELAHKAAKAKGHAFMLRVKFEDLKFAYQNETNKDKKLSIRELGIKAHTDYQTADRKAQKAVKEYEAYQAKLDAKQAKTTPAARRSV